MILTTQPAVIGLRDFIPQMSLVAVAAGAGALLIEVDDNRALQPEVSAGLVNRMRALAAAVGREL